MTADSKHARQLWMCVLVVSEVAFIVNGVTGVIYWGSGRLSTVLMVLGAAVPVAMPLLMLICGRVDRRSAATAPFVPLDPRSYAVPRLHSVTTTDKETVQ